MRENKDRVHLERILESIEVIIAHVKGFDYDHFLKDQKTFDAVLMQFVNIGEMINRLSDDFHEEYNHLPWHKAVGMRNEIAHGYLDVKPEVVWKTVMEDLPQLKSDIDIILNN